MGADRTAEKKRAIQLRLKGKSYNEIRRALNVSSKGTISSWLKGLKLPALAKKKLADNIQRAHDRGLFRFNNERMLRIQSENKTAHKEGRDTVRKISARELTLIGAALYWGEGTKSFAIKNNASVSFTNSDPKMVALFMRFLREIIDAPEARIRAGIHIYDGINERLARKYWGNIMNLPVDRFYIIRQVSRASQGKRNSRTLPFGTIAIRYNDRKAFYRVLGMIDGLSGNSIRVR